MSDLQRALKQLEIRGARVATQAANDGIGTDLLKVMAAAGAHLSCPDLTSEETVKKVAETLMMFISGEASRKCAAEAVLRAVKGDTE